jgi:hypothetical protein
MLLFFMKGRIFKFQPNLLRNLVIISYLVVQIDPPDLLTLKIVFSTALVNRFKVLNNIKVISFTQPCLTRL